MKKAKCYNCKKVLTYAQDLGGPSEFVHDERDIDGVDIFLCGSIRGCRFKLDMKYYMANRHKKNFIAKTVDADWDFSEGHNKKPKKKIQRSIFRKARNIFGMQLMITFKKTFDYYATDNELGDYITLMADVVTGDVDPQIEFDVESDDHHRYVIVNILDKVLH